ncbi:MAG: DEAD/DEAH box helicase [Deltaproteobacteria bacterium]|nr:DEAD/DEAH box helicase [Deltaproteobacteria bacterium]
MPSDPMPPDGGGDEPADTTRQGEAEATRAREAALRTDVAVLGRRVARYQKEIYDYGTSWVPGMPTWGAQSLGSWLQVRDPAVRGAQRWGQSFVQTIGQRAAADAALREARAANSHAEAEERPEVAAALALRERMDAPDVVRADPALRAGLEAVWAQELGRFTVTRRALAACLRHEACDEATIDLADPARPLARCRYAADAPCTLKLMAVEALLDLMARGAPDNPVRAWLARPPWQRLVDRLQVVGATKDLALRPSEPDAQLGWVVGDGDVELVWVRPRKRQDGLTVDRLGAVGKDLDALLEDPRDRVAIVLARGERPPSPAARVGPVLSALVGHPRVWARHEGELVHVRVVAEDPAIGLGEGADGARLVARQAGRELTLDAPPRAGTWLVSLRPEVGEIVVGRWTRGAALAWEAWAKAPAPVPAEGRDALAQTLVGLMRDVPVALDGAWLGQAFPPADVVVFRLGFAGSRGARVLSIEGLVEPVPELGPRAPATGHEVVPVRRPIAPGDAETHIGHVPRDFAHELSRVRDVAAHAGLDPEVHAWRIDQLERALDVVRALEALARQPDAGGRLRLEWLTREPVVTRAQRSDRLRIQIGQRKDWLGLSGGLVVGGAELPLGELLEALRDRKRFVVLDDDRYVELDDALRQRLAPLATIARRDRQGLTASPLAAPLFAELERAGVDVEAPPFWLEQRRRVDEALAMEPALPEGLQAELRPYQVEGFRWLARLAHWARGACLADDMGLGKTLMALGLLLHRVKEGPILVVAPTSVVPNWVREAERFAPSLAPVVVSGQGALDRLDAPVVVTTYDVLVRNEAAFAARPWATLVLDEAQAVKNAATRRAQAVKNLDVRFALALTGTPVENHPSELWSLFQVVAPGLLGSSDVFREELQRGPESLARLARLVRPFILRRTKAEVASDLPPRVEVRVDVVLGPEERERYEQIRRSAIAELRTSSAGDTARVAVGGGRPGGGSSVIKVLAVLMRLRQLACHPRLVDPTAPLQSAKLERLVALVEELRAESRRVLVFSQFTELLALVRGALDAAGVTWLQLDGQTPAAERPRLVDAFQAGEADVFLLSLKAGGVGLNLTAASEVVLLDPWWNPAVEDQAADRAHRIGQDKAVTIYRLVAADTIEDQILKLHGDKRALVSELLDGTSSAKPLSADELISLL